MSNTVTNNLWKNVLEDVEKVRLKVIAYFRGDYHILFEGSGERFFVQAQVSGDWPYITSLKSLGLTVDEENKYKLLENFEMYSIVKIVDADGNTYRYQSPDMEK